MVSAGGSGGSSAVIFAMGSTGVATWVFPWAVLGVVLKVMCLVLVFFLEIRCGEMFTKKASI